jgi:hypothetical protein
VDTDRTLRLRVADDALLRLVHAQDPAEVPGVKQTASRRVVYGLIAFFVVGGLLLLGGAAWSYLDEHSGKAAHATVTRCVSGGSGKGRTLYCTGTWEVDGRTVKGAVYNGRRGDVGKSLSVRLHGGHASRPQVGVSIALAIFGLLILAMCGWLVVLWRRRGAQPT